MLFVDLKNMYVKVVLLAWVGNSTFIDAVSCVCANCPTKQGYKFVFFVSNFFFRVRPVRW